jgi:UPF0716 protein FxsA
MLGYLIVLFTLIPIIELAVLIKVGTYVGVMHTITLVLLTGVAGALLARSQGMRVLTTMQHDLAKGLMPADSLFDGFMVLAGGLLLLTPGFITDGIGFVMLVPYTRILLKGWIKRKVKRMVEDGRFATSFQYYES